MHDLNHSINPETGSLVKEAALAAMSAWVAAIANNIKNPLAGIGAALDILARDLDRIKAEAAQVDIGASQEAIDRIKLRMALLNEYVTELVDFAKPPIVSRRRIPLISLFPALKESLLEVGADPEVVEFSVADDCHFVLADEARLQLILKALIINAMEAIGASKKARIKVTAGHQTFGDQNGVIISVEDNGPGFFDKVMTHIFDPFFSTKEASTGLGLTLVKKYVDAHGGTIMISSSNALGGAKIEIFLPDQLD